MTVLTEKQSYFPQLHRQPWRLHFILEVLLIGLFSHRYSKPRARIKFERY